MKPDFDPRENPCRPRHFKPASCGPLPVEGPAKQTLETSRTRLVLLGALFCVAFAAIGLRLVDVTVLKDQGPRIARAHVRPHFDHARADILDRNGVKLATTLETPSLFANPKLVQGAGDAAAKLAAVLPGLDRQDLEAALSNKERSFVWIKRNLTPEQQFEVNRLGIPGLFFQTEQRRFYPQGRLTAHVVGFADVDNNGLQGVERGLDDELKTGDGPVTLSIDLRLQYILKEEVTRQIESFSAKGGMGMIADVETGEILAMVSLPDFDPNDRSAVDSDATFNRATLGTYEMGSVFKIFNTAMALDSHVTTLGGGYDASHPLQVGRFTIHDDHAKNRWLSVPEIF
ncbi:MAG TPA: penicillin-binding transpeptidase domain-containing protein, partial [Stellaceae bacterium]|nr:penicillin-binding transpeptidase domain-containing protein [Stellaceae bacterium]